MLCMMKFIEIYVLQPVLARLVAFKQVAPVQYKWENYFIANISILSILPNPMFFRRCIIIYDEQMYLIERHCIFVQHTILNLV